MNYNLLFLGTFYSPRAIDQYQKPLQCWVPVWVPEMQMAGEKLLSEFACKGAKASESIYYINDGAGLRLFVDRYLVCIRL